MEHADDFDEVATPEIAIKDQVPIDRMTTNAGAEMGKGAARFSEL